MSLPARTASGNEPGQGTSSRSPWTWVPTLYLAEGLPYVVVMTVSVIMYKGFGVSNTDIALYTSWLYLPWVIKPLWSPVVDLIATRRRWIWTMQLLLAGGFAAVAFAAPAPDFLRWTMIAFAVLAFSSATHDIAADGYYMLAATEKQQAFFVGVRTMFYRIANIFGQGLLVMLAGTLQARSGDPHAAWSVTMGALAVLFLVFALWHRFMLPRAAADVPGEARRIPQFLREFLATFASFFRREKMGAVLFFLLVYRLGEAQLAKMGAPFLLDAREQGGLGITTTQVGFLYGTIGVAALTVGGILGGWAIARDGLKRWLWFMLIAIQLPDVLFVYLAAAQPTDLNVVMAAVAVEQFGYGFGFTAYVVYMLYLARGTHSTAHYAICTGFMALGMMLPGMWSGWLEDQIGYRNFFIWVCIATIPSFFAAAWVPLEAAFGKRAQT